MKKIVTIVGARPQFIKAAVLSRLLAKPPWNKLFKEVLVHTGQHYDANMSDIFFKEMNIPVPDFNLKIGSALHGKMTGTMLIRIEEVLISEKPDVVLVYGDTNSTLAGALAASKLNIPLAHIEAGLRSFCKTMPEEQNRVLTDHLASLLFCPTTTATKNLKNEGILKGVYLTGDIMYDASLYYRSKIEKKISGYFTRLSAFSDIKNIVLNNNFFLVTVHRAENTDDPKRLQEIVKGLNGSDIPGIFPIHPRTRKTINHLKLKFKPHIKLVDPLGYLEMLELEMRCKFIVTDSGGIQKEAFFFKKPCITLRDQTEWVETVDSRWNTLAGADKERIIYSMKNISTPNKYSNFYGDGNCTLKILKILGSIV